MEAGDEAVKGGSRSGSLSLERASMHGQERDMRHARCVSRRLGLWTRFQTPPALGAKSSICAVDWSDDNTEFPGSKVDAAAEKEFKKNKPKCGAALPSRDK